MGKSRVGLDATVCGAGLCVGQRMKPPASYPCSGEGWLPHSHSRARPRGCRYHRVPILLKLAVRIQACDGSASGAAKRSPMQNCATEQNRWRDHSAGFGVVSYSVQTNFVESGAQPPVLPEPCPP
jgi:hypothetical protein